MQLTSKVIKYFKSKFKLNWRYRIRPKYVSAINKKSTTLNGIVAYNRYGGYFTPLSSQQRPAVQKILGGQIYEPDTISYMIENCKNGDIIHAGTFFGDFLPGISSALIEGAKIWAFEPNPESFKCAQITCIMNDLLNVNLFNAGLGDNKSKVNMLVKTESGTSLGGASKISDGHQTGETVQIEIVRIDDIIPDDRPISILHLDVEGYEKPALIGAMETIKRNKPILILEDNKNIIETDWFNENVLKLGYEIVGKVHGNTVIK